MKKSRQNKEGNTWKKSTLDNRPPFNLDTRIDGYDDVDENGRYKRRASKNPQTPKKEHDDYNIAWINSLRGSFYGNNNDTN